MPQPSGCRLNGYQRPPPPRGPANSNPEPQGLGRGGEAPSRSLSATRSSRGNGAGKGRTRSRGWTTCPCNFSLPSEPQRRRGLRKRRGPARPRQQVGDLADANPSNAAELPGHGHRRKRVSSGHAKLVERSSHFCGSLEEPGNVDEEENAGPGQAERGSAQEKPQSSENRWLKYLERDSKELGIERGVCFERPPLCRTEKPEPPFNTGLPRKRKCSQSAVWPPHSPDVQNLSDSEVTLEPQKDHAGLAGKVMEGGSHKDGGTGELSVPQGGPPRPAPQLRATSSKWDRFLLLPGNGPRVDTEPPVPLHRDPRPAGAALAEQGTPREGRPSRPLSAPKLPWPTHTLTSGSQRPCGKPPGQPQDTGPLAKGRPTVTGVQEPPLVRLCDLFESGEDFEDDL
ncbi:MRN complex-interacting protein isoform X1 [Mirounga angustirostris]|uniref:MRN complex-interacting protein isoform X1 n=1 Tax=Mirounga angustirostris TaxID=9716 RepID=UPI00313E8330